MHTTTLGIVLKKTPYTGSSAVVNMYTRRYGQMAFMVRRVGKKGTKAAALEPLTQVDVSFRLRVKNTMQTVSQIDLKSGASLHSHPLKSAITLFLAEVLYKTLREEAANEALFDFLNSALDWFHADTFSPNFHLILLVKLTRYFGFSPLGEWSQETPFFDLINGEFTANKNASLHMFDSDTAQVFNDMAVNGFKSRSLNISNVQRRKLLNGMVEFYQIQLDGMGTIKSLGVLTEVFS